jgi:hypothetical protein
MICCAELGPPTLIIAISRALQKRSASSIANLEVRNGPS